MKNIPEIHVESALRFPKYLRDLLLEDETRQHRGGEFGREAQGRREKSTETKSRIATINNIIIIIIMTQDLIRHGEQPPSSVLFHSSW